MQKQFQNQNVWIIGASTGIGMEMAFYFSRHGANIIVSARSKDSLKNIVSKTGGKQDFVLPLDVQNVNEVKNAVSKITKKFNKLDRVIFMAGIYEPTACNEIDIEKARQIIDTNFKGAVNIVHYCLPVLEKQDKSQLVLCASVAGYSGLPNGQPYSATKAAILNFAESLRAEYVNSTLDIKVINPGFVKTRLTDKNKFKMPFIIEPKEAAEKICSRLNSKSFEIHFPKKLSLILKFFRLIPYPLYFWLVSKFQL